MIAIPGSTRELLRMRDVALVLRESAQYQVDLAKVQLQKLIYLLDSITFIYAVLAPKSGHITYLAGPWDAAIQHAVDALVFRGLVRATAVTRIEVGIAAMYRLEPSGHEWANLLGEISSIRPRAEAVKDLCSHVNTVGWARLRELVYAEPTYVRLRESGRGLHLKPADRAVGGETSFSLISVMEMALKANWPDAIVPNSYLVELYLMFLDRMSVMQRSQTARLR